MSSRNRQVLVLVLLVAGFVWLIGRQLVPAMGGSRPGLAPGRSATGLTGGLTEGPVEITELRLDALEHKPATYEPGRDPFRFAVRPRPPRPAPPKPDPAAARRAAQASRPRRPPPKPRPAQPKPPAIEFVYLGSFGMRGHEIAVFSDGKEILNAFAGDVLQREFVVRSIGFESADIGFVNFPDAPAKRLAVGG